MPTPVPAGLRLGVVEPKEAFEAFAQRKLLQQSFRWQDVWQEEHTRVFAVAGVTKVDVLRVFYDELAPAIAEGRSLADFTKAVKPRLVAKGFWGDVVVRSVDGKEERVTRFDERRLELIYDVNTRQSFAAGRWARIERLKGRFPYVMYRTMRDERVRASHRPWDGVTLPVDHPFWNTHYPPCGWRCRCTAFGVDDKALDRYRAAGLPVKTEAPPEQLVPLVSRATGEVIKVPRGIDPGFAYNPGKVHLARAGELFGEALQALPAPAASAVVQASVQSAAFADFYAAPLKGEQWPVALLSDEQAGRLGAASRVVILSEATALKQRARHPEVSPADYLWAQRAVQQGEELQDSARSIVFVLEHDGWVVVVQATRTGKAVFMKSLRRISSDAARRDAELARLRQRAAGN